MVNRGTPHDEVRNYRGYDGTTNLHDFFCQFERASQLAGWNMDTKVCVLVSSLRGSAVRILSELEADERGNYVSLIKALCDMYETDSQCQLFKV